MRNRQQYENLYSTVQSERYDPRGDRTFDADMLMQWFMSSVDQRVMPRPLMIALQIGMELDDWQRAYLTSDHDQIALNCCRQSGKSTSASIEAVSTVLDDNKLVLVVSPKLDQSKELYRKCLRVYKQLGKPIPIKSVTTLSLELENGSRIICLPDREDTTRGYSGVDLLIIDEASRVSDATYYAVRPMLAVSGGKMRLLSTPHGQRGFYHKEYTEGRGWMRVEVDAYHIERIPRAFLESERRSMGDLWFSQEYLCEFVEASGSLFRPEDLRMLFSDPTVLPIFPDLARRQPLGIEVEHESESESEFVVLAPTVGGTLVQDPHDASPSDPMDGYNIPTPFSFDWARREQRKLQEQGGSRRARNGRAARRL